MSLENKIVLGLCIALFIAAKVYFLFNTPKSLAVAALPAAILILSSPSSANATEPQM